MPRPALALLGLLLFVTGCASDPDTASRPEKPADDAASEAGATRNESYNSKTLFDVRDAEEEGEAYPKAAPPDRTSPIFARSLRGTSKRECVEVPRRTGVRSGEFVARVEIVYTDESTGKRYAKIPWSRLHLSEEYFANEGDVAAMTVRVAPLEDPSRIKARKLSETAGNASGEFYTSGTPLPGEGPWRMIATSGPDWGCFDLKAS